LKSFKKSISGSTISLIELQIAFPQPFCHEQTQTHIQPFIGCGDEETQTEHRF
jgi:hypothetical protein